MSTHADRDRDERRIVGSVQGAPDQRTDATTAGKGTASAPGGEPESGSLSRRRMALAAATTAGAVTGGAIGLALGRGVRSSQDEEPEQATGATADGSPPPWPPTRTASRGHEGDLLFDAQFEQQGFAAYDSAAPAGIEEGVDYGLEADPLGGDRLVAWFDSHRSLSVGNNHPRVGLSTPPVVAVGEERWFQVDLMVPSENALDQPDDWNKLATAAFGPPFGGSSPLGFSVVRSRDSGWYFQIGADYSILGETIPFPFDRWIRVVQGFELSVDGWCELWLGEPDEALSPILLSSDGGVRTSSSTLRPEINGEGDNFSRIGVYSPRPTRAHFASHRIARTREALDWVE